MRRFIRSRPRSRRCSCASPEGRWHDRDPHRAPVGCDRPSEERFLLGERVSDHRHQCAPSVCARERARQFRTLGTGHPGHQPPDHDLLLRGRSDAPRARRGDAQRPRRLAAFPVRLPGDADRQPDRTRCGRDDRHRVDRIRNQRFVVADSWGNRGAWRHLYRFWRSRRHPLRLGERSVTSGLCVRRAPAPAAAASFRSCTASAVLRSPTRTADDSDSSRLRRRSTESTSHSGSSARLGWSAIAFVWGRNRVRALMHNTRASGGR